MTYLVWRCLQVDGIKAWATILRRCYCVALCKLQQSHKLPAEEVAKQLHGSLPTYSIPALADKVDKLLAAGSHYGMLERDLGEGVLFVLGCELPREL